MSNKRKLRQHRELWQHRERPWWAATPEDEDATRASFNAALAAGQTHEDLLSEVARELLHASIDAGMYPLGAFQALLVAWYMQDRPDVDWPTPPNDYWCATHDCWFEGNGGCDGDECLVEPRWGSDEDFHRARWDELWADEQA